MISESELVRKCKEGEPRYQEMLYQKFSAVLMGICVRYAKNKEDAEDIMHDSFVKIFTNIGSYEGIGSLEAWGKRITVNTAINAYHLKVKTGFAVDVDEMQGVITDVRIKETDFLSESVLLQFINELPDGYRTIFNLYEIDGYSHLEIAEMTGVTFSTVSAQLFKAKRALKKKIENYFGTELKYYTDRNKSEK